MFYDLNLGVDGVGEQSRREMVAMAMQLGYSGVAANHTLTGVMADSDRCKICPLELQIILSAAPAMAEAARFHRGLLGVPHGLPFRQFTRITVVVENPAQANALNSGNPLLKTYDIVAVRPTNQKAFNQACSHSEVDMISLDVSQKLPFRLKMPVVKAAIQVFCTSMGKDVLFCKAEPEFNDKVIIPNPLLVPLALGTRPAGLNRGIYFEISYGRTIFDPKARRELFANAQMLLAAARGRNIIMSSGARRALELRGPNDAANMSTLFGLSLESAKAAVSRNCKAVLMHGVMRKATHRGAIHIDRPSVQENAVDPNNLFNVPTDWDPLSLGGASADFIPMDDTLDVVPKKDSLPSSKLAVTEKIMTGTTWVGDIRAVVGATSKSSGDEEQPDMQEEEEKAIQEKHEGDSKVTVSEEHDLLKASARGIQFNSTVRDPIETSAIAKQESMPHFSRTPLGKQAFRENKKKVELNVVKLVPKKGNKRKRRK